MSDEQLVVTRSDWVDSDKTSAFGVTKAVFKPKNKTPGMKAILVHDESFRRVKSRLKFFPEFRPGLDLPELISAMIDVCVADEELMRRVGSMIIEQREHAIGAMKERYKNNI